MIGIRVILLKSVIIPFYRSHTGLLLFVLWVMFGTVESSQLVSYHRSLIEGMFVSKIFMPGLDALQFKNFYIYPDAPKKT
jgi:hypothetical protein